MRDSGLDLLRRGKTRLPPVVLEAQPDGDEREQHAQPQKEADQKDDDPKGTVLERKPEKGSERQHEGQLFRQCGRGPGMRATPGPHAAGRNNCAAEPHRRSRRRMRATSSTRENGVRT